MRFKIYKTSDWSGRTKPCDGAVPVETSSRKQEWAIDIESLEGLVALMVELDEELVLGRRKGVDGPVTIEIYDDYRE